MKIEASLQKVWEKFSLQIETDLVFESGKTYHLLGSNGSGKSSFITQILLPRLLAGNDVYTLYFEQQMHLQLQTIKAYARVFYNTQPINTEQEAITFLLANLQLAWEQENRPIFIVMDESLHELQIQEYLQNQVPSACLIFTSHTGLIRGTNEIYFELVSPVLGKVHASLA